MTTATADNSHEPEVASGKPRYDDVNVPVIILVGVISAILTFVTIVSVQGLCYQWRNSKIKDRAVVNMPAREYIDAQKQVLAGGDGIVPISEAMDKIVKEFGGE